MNANTPKYVLSLCTYHTIHVYLFCLKGMAHITGGGLLDNLPRVLPDHLAAVVDLPASTWVLPPVFKWLQTLANLPQVK